MNEKKIDEMSLALLTLGLHDGMRTWKGFSFEVMNRLHEKGYIENPVSKTKSVVFTEEGLALAEKLFAEYFGA